MRKTILVLIFIFFPALLPARELPLTIFHGGEKNHVQGIALDADQAKMYFSFTTRFVVTDLQGREIGSVDRIHGHLGAMTFDKDGRKVYASLECKDDVIGASISKGLGEQVYQESRFYIAEIDVDAITRPDTPMESVMTLYDVVPANEDYRAVVTVDGRELSHRYGCSGIDGVAVGPGFGKDRRHRYLYVAYGVYSDVNRPDNDYQVILQYRLGKFSKPSDRIFVKTGNTNYGVQNLAFDPQTGRLFMAVYKGQKPQYRNYQLFSVDMSLKPSRGILEGVPYGGKQLVAPLAGEGWYFRHGSMGLCPLGEGLWYIAEGSSAKDENGRTIHSCTARLYEWIGKDDSSSRPFSPVRR